ncbi:restriction endonuclease subunit S [Desulfococcaceae bacterium HSG8]|nr:restriction endonuclease subunit S [Desulfococcaceae bacterium HSG8]
MKLRKETWDQVELKEILQFKNGFNFNKGTRHSGWRLFGVSDFQDHFFAKYKDIPFLIADRIPSDDYLLRDNDMLFVRSNGNRELVGRTLLFKEIPFNATFSAFCIRGRIYDSNVDPIYLAYCTKSSAFRDNLIRLVQGTNITSISQTLLSQLEIPIPPLEEQKQIAALFQSIDTAIEQTEAQEKNLFQTKRQLLWELFSEKQEFGSYLNSENYKTIYFGDVSQHISKRVAPAKTDLKIYVGLEHLDPDNLRIERQGSPADVKGTKLLVWKGDIIFGKRRAYQRKIAVSHFEGICSAHSMVLRAKEDVIKKEFLPYFMQSDVFMDRAVQISEGSLSPTIKWKVLEKQKFAIPKMEFQEKLTGLFRHFDKLIYELKGQKKTLTKLKQKLLDEIFG